MPTSKQLSIISRQLELSDFKFFIDRQIDGDDLYRVLTDAGMKIERHRTHFDPDADDPVWITQAGRAQWVIITADAAIERDHMDAVCDSKAQVVILTDNTSGYPQWAGAIIAGTLALLRNLLTRGKPLIIRLGRNGSIARVRGPEEMEKRRRVLETSRIIREKKGAGGR